MSHTTTILVTVHFGGDELEVLVEVEFTITPGSPASGPTYSCGGEPAEPAEIDYVNFWTKIPIAGQAGHFSHEPAPQWLADFLTNSGEVYQKCGDASDWGERDDYD